MENNPGNSSERSKTLKSLLLGGILPLVAYTLVEEYCGTLWGLVAGMVLGITEIIVEKIQRGKVDGITWAGNLLLFGMGGISLATNEGMWFKLQPAILELATGGMLLGSVFLKKPFLALMVEKQGTFAKFPPEVGQRLKQGMTGITVRLAVFFFLHAGLATWAALHWSTKAWVFLKGIGFTVTLAIYMLVEALGLRRRLRK